MADDDEIIKVMMVSPPSKPMATWEKILVAVLWLELIRQIIMPPTRRRRG